MILADSSVWINNYRTPNPVLDELLATGQVLMHSFVLGELALGNMKDRARTLFSLARLPSVLPARPREVLQLIENARLYGRGIGYADANLLASVRVVPGARLWSNDKRLATVALDLGIGYVPLAEP